MPFESSQRYLGQRCFHNFGHVELCLSVFDINRRNAHLREISRPSKLLLPKMKGLPDFGFLGSFTRTQTARSQARKQTQIWLRYTRRCTKLSQKDHKELWGIESITPLCFAVNGRVQEAKVDGRRFCLVFSISLMTPHCAVFAPQEACGRM